MRGCWAGPRIDEGMLGGWKRGMLGKWKSGREGVVD